MASLDVTLVEVEPPPIADNGCGWGVPGADLVGRGRRCARGRKLRNEEWKYGGLDLRMDLNKRISQAAY